MTYIDNRDPAYTSERRRLYFTKGDGKGQLYAFCNGGSPGWLQMITLDGATGHGVAGHCCSHEAYGPHDMGVTSNWKHAEYDALYPSGWTIEWLEITSKADLDAHPVLGPVLKQLEDGVER